jgi:AcrR family transcriptional regulator
MEKRTAMARVGRPRTFDRNVALDRAMVAFWERGYDAVTLEQLQAVMGGITAPSLYAAFGSKEKLFLEAIDRYMAAQQDLMPSALSSEPTARGSIEALLRVAVNAFTQPGKPRGCMVTLSAVNCSKGQEHVQNHLRQVRQLRHALILERLQQGILDGDLNPDTDVARLARFFSIFLDGLSFQARDGATRKDLNAAADDAMGAWSHQSVSGPASGRA